MSDSFNLERFVAAQKQGYEAAFSELSSGKKRTHWMWYIFPQVRGLGSSTTAKKYAIAGEEEAKAYLSHPILGERLIACCYKILELSGHSAQDVFGVTDAMKLRSAMTLFASVSDSSVFMDVLYKYYEGSEDPSTMQILSSADKS